MKDDWHNHHHFHTAPVSVSIKKTSKILEQLKKSIFEIKCKEKNSTGFLCKIKYENEIKNTLIINYQIFVEKIKENKILEIYFNDNEVKKKINLENLFKKDEILNYALIEIKEEDGINTDDLLELDENLLKDDSEIFYKDESVYVLQYKEENKASVSYGVILEIYGNELTINNDIGECSLGAPILNLSNNKVIGICNGFKKESFKRKGLNFKYIMNEFNPKKEIEVENEIKITFNIEKEDVGKQIYFMYNIFKNMNLDENNCLDSHEQNLIARVKDLEIMDYFFDLEYKQLAIYINEIEQKELKYYFEPTDAKLYTIRIKFKKEIPDCSYMFYDCDKIISIDLSSFISKNLNNMRYMFNGCTNLRHINFSNIKTKNVINMERIFYNCSMLNYLDLSNFDTRKTVHMQLIFDYLYNLEYLDISSWNTSITTYCYGFFGREESEMSQNVTIIISNKLKYGKDQIYPSWKVINIDEF